MMGKTGTRFSKRQAGMEVTPVLAKTKKKDRQTTQTEDGNISEKVSETGNNTCHEEDQIEEQESEEGNNTFEEEEYDEALEDEDVEQPESSHGQEQETVPHPTSKAQTQQLETKKRKTRGPTRMRKVAKHHDDKVEVEFTEIGEHVGGGSVTLSSFIGPLVREHVPELLKDWRELSEETKDTLWEEIQGRFNLTEGWQKEYVFKQMGRLWRTSKSRLTKLVQNTKSKVQLQKLKPNNIQSTAAWNSWVRFRNSTAFKIQSEKYRQLRKRQIPHTTSRKGMVRLAHEMEKVKSIDSEMESTATTNFIEDAKLEATQAELLSKIEDLQIVVHDLAGKKRGSDDVSASDVPDGNKEGIRCQLLDWCSSDDIVVGEGELCSTEHMYKIGRIPLGPNAAAVIVKSVAKPEAYVWRPTPTILILGDTIGLKIAWPAEKAANASTGRVHIFDWNWEGEIIGEGILCSTDPKDLVNNIPLGPNAASLKVVHVERGNAFLWRPSAEMSVLSDALNENLAWPIDKVQLVNPATSPEKTARNSQAVTSEGNLTLLLPIQIYIWIIVPKEWRNHHHVTTKILNWFLLRCDRILRLLLLSFFNMFPPIKLLNHHLLDLFQHGFVEALA
ncbi:unnamed protein product [Microthlaspi erraticum]|uniref:Uncharacterized protein n=1 Tax=Microthlaspi erraticum TaxID=1685480 RepID=A0A6D2HT41_9BRAS|nr:unnamed protein product [Microthlaspi erraticum]